MRSTRGLVLVRRRRAQKMKREKQGLRDHEGSPQRGIGCGKWADVVGRAGDHRSTPRNKLAPCFLDGETFSEHRVEPWRTSRMSRRFYHLILPRLRLSVCV